MKYRFITILHNMKLNTVKNKGTQIYPGARISNGNQELLKMMETELMKATAGLHSVDEFKNTVYFYIDGEFEDICSEEEMDQVGMQYTFFFLRQAQFFTNSLWEIKDNNVYVRDGFLLAYDDDFEDGLTYKASLSAINSYSTGKKVDSIFSDEELSQAIQRFEPASKNEFDNDRYEVKFPTADFLFKNKGSQRIRRATYFTLLARGSSILPMKILNYCTALECLFTNGTSEVNHKISERVALMLGISNEHKIQLFQLIKSAYNVRSKVVHGQYLKGTEEDLIMISKELDSVLRDLLTANHEVFSFSDNEMESFFIDLLFQYSK